MVKNFRYEEPGRVARSGAPQSAAEIDWLYEQGIRAVVSLHPVPAEAVNRMEELGIRWRPSLTPDFAEAAPDDFLSTLDFICRHADGEPAVLIHCQGGGGRSPVAPTILNVRRVTEGRIWSCHIGLSVRYSQLKGFIS